MGKRVHASPSARRAADLWGGLRETREILDDPVLMEQLRLGASDMAEGKLIAWESVEMELAKRKGPLQ